MMKGFICTGIVFAIALMQGITLLLFAAASPIMLSKDHLALTPGEYSSLFLVIVFGGVLAFLSGCNSAARSGLRSVTNYTLLASVLSMFLFAVSLLLENKHMMQYALLIAAAFLIGLSFGGTTTSLKTYVELLFPKESLRAIFWLRAILGFGATLSPLIFLAASTATQIFALAPLTIGIALLTLLFAGRMVLPNTVVTPAYQRDWLGSQIWIFPILSFFYGSAESLVTCWLLFYLIEIKQSSLVQAELLFSFFFLVLSIGRVMYATFSNKTGITSLLRVSPVAIAIGFVLLSYASTLPVLIASIFILASGCSLCLPLIATIGERANPGFAALVWGRIAIAYALGYGTTAYFIGMLLDMNWLELANLFYLGMIPALLMASISSRLKRKSAF